MSIWAPVSASQIIAVASAEAEAIHLPSGEMRTWEIGFSWPRSSSEGSKLGRSGAALREGREGVVEVDRFRVRREEVRERERERERDLERDLERESRRDRDRDLDLDLDLDLDCDAESEREAALDLERDRDLEGGLYARSWSPLFSVLSGSMLRDRDCGLPCRIERLRRWPCGEAGDGSRVGSGSVSCSGSESGELCSALPSFRLRRLEA